MHYSLLILFSFLFLFSSTCVYVDAEIILPGSCGLNKYYNNETDGDAVAPAGAQLYIVGGKKARENNYPWQVSFQAKGQHTCGGTIISEWFILTAAHCIITEDVNRWRVVAGKHSLAKNEPTQAIYQVKSLVKHKKYSIVTKSNDLTLVKLATKIQFTDEIQPICLPPPTIGKLEGQLATVTGWGATVEGGHASSILQETQLPIISNEKCAQLYGDEKIDSGMICAGYEKGGKDACDGDSGGPMAMKFNGTWTLVGVTSWGYGCAKPNRPGGYARITYFLEWLQNNMIFEK